MLLGLRAGHRDLMPSDYNSNNDNPLTTTNPHPFPHDLYNPHVIQLNLGCFAVMADVSSVRKRKRRASVNNATAIPASSPIASQSLFYPLTLHVVPEDTSEFESEPEIDAAGPTDAFPANDDRVDNRDEQPAPPTGYPAGAEGQPSTPSITTDYDCAVARINTLQSHLTAGMALNLTSLLAVIHTHLTSPPGIHPLFEQIACPLTSNDEIITLA